MVSLKNIERLANRWFSITAGRIASRAKFKSNRRILRFIPACRLRLTLLHIHGRNARPSFFDITNNNGSYNLGLKNCLLAIL